MSSELTSTRSKPGEKRKPSMTGTPSSPKSSVRPTEKPREGPKRKHITRSEE
jgi:hypothetical protein